MYTEDDYIQLSSIQHFIFCKRQCALIHVAGLWDENVFTAKGKLLHERADSGEDERRGDTLIVRSLNIYSKRLGLSGKADVVEFTEKGEAVSPYPVEYKVGQPKSNISDLAQVCAQSLCLEEMMKTPVRTAAIFYGRPRKRLVVEIDDALRSETERVIDEVHILIRDRTIPSAKYEKKCDTCSLNEVCMPRISDNRLKAYVREVFNTDEETC